MKKARRYQSYINPANLLGIMGRTRTASRFFSKKIKDGRVVKYRVNDTQKVFKRKSEAKAFRNKLNGGPGGGSYHIITLGK